MNGAAGPALRILKPMGDKMLNQKELQRIRRLIDFSVEDNDPEIVIIRDKISDMITLQKAWNKGKRIEEDQIHDYATGP